MLCSLNLHTPHFRIVMYLSIRVVWSDNEIIDNFAVVNHLLQLERSTAESLHWAS